MWELLYLDEFEKWWSKLNKKEQEVVDAGMILLEEFGPNLSRPFSDTLKGSKYKNMKELRLQCGGKPYRIIYIFDPKRKGVIILGGNKTGDNNWYDKNIKIADKLYSNYLSEN